jgi:general secretion pathway protein G
MRRKKKPLTLIEIMVVIFLIGLIGSVLGFKMKNSLEDGKAFKTRAKIEKIHDVLTLEMAKGKNRDQVINNAAKLLSNSALFKEKADDILLDGWGGTIEIAPKGNRNIQVTSEALKEYDEKHNTEEKKLTK